MTEKEIKIFRDLQTIKDQRYHVRCKMFFESLETEELLKFTKHILTTVQDMSDFKETVEKQRILKQIQPKAHKNAVLIQLLLNKMSYNRKYRNLVKVILHLILNH